MKNIKKVFKVKFVTVDDVAKFVDEATKLDFDIFVCSETNHYVIDGKSMMGIFTLNLSNPLAIKVPENIDDDTINDFHDKIEKLVVL